MIKYKIDVLAALKAAGFNTNRIRKEKLLPESAVQSLRHDEMISLSSLDRICSMLNAQPGDILMHENESKSM